MKDPLAQVQDLVEKVRAHLGADDPGPKTEDPEVIADYWVVRYFESRGYTYYPPPRSARPETAKLAERGWRRKWRVPSMVDTNRRPPMPRQDPLARDPVARVIRKVYIDQTLVMTPEELLEEAKREARGERLDAAAAPAGRRELHDHLVRIAPGLQTRRLFADEEEVNHFSYFARSLPRDRREYCRYGYVKTEYWDNAKSGEGLWVFTAFRSRRRAIEGTVVRSVWEKVKILEKVAEHLSEPLHHRPAEEEDGEVREAVKDLSIADLWASPDE
jgi:hypothetical protein